MLTFAPMVDSETVRLLLRHYGIPFTERDHLFGWGSLLTLFHGGYGAVPFVYRPGMRLTGPRPLVDRCDAALPAAARLVPVEPDLHKQAEADWQTYNGGLGADVAVFAYFHLLPARDLMTPIFAARVSSSEARLTSTAYPMLSFLLRTLLWLTPARARDAADRIRSAFAATDRRLADGRRYLCGDRLTVGDIALAAASAPLLQPRGYGAKMPPVDAMPAAVADLMRELRSHPTAAFVDRLYEESFVGYPVPDV